MALRRLSLIAAILALSAGCSPSGGDAPPEASPQTRAYLQALGVVRSQLTADNAGAIPAMMSRQDSEQLTEQVARLGHFRHDLGSLDDAGVDPKAVQLQRGVGASLEAYRSVCLDAAELFREVKDADAKFPAHAPASRAIAKSMQIQRMNTLAALDTLLAATDDIDLTPGAGVNLSPIIAAVRSDRRKLEQATEAEQALARQVSAAPAP